MNALYHAHSGLRYLVMLAALAALLTLGYALVAGRQERLARILARSFVGVLDLQIVLGIALVVAMGGSLSDALAGHLLAMVPAAVVAHGSSLVAQRARSSRRELGIRLAGIAVTLVLVVIGISLLGRSLLGSSPPRA